ncbi:MAG: Methionyl-tRNA formyltransferase [Parcubacteria group bacterium GW2011_GWC2_38_7]|nr:MAG: Methionyl-tRNA formyltransferase [Parcubacteria group bacterium GW2011_GWC2_38_7]
MNKKDIKIIFIGSANFSVLILKMLIKEYSVQLVITEEDKIAGRGKKISSPPTKLIAIENQIPCTQPEKVKNNQELFNQIRDLHPTILIVAAYGKLLPKEILEMTKFGCLNVHPSLLPKYRGPSPIQTVLLNGENKTGVSIMLLNSAMDEGEILIQEEMPINSDEIYAELEEKLTIKSTEILDMILPRYINHEVELLKQNSLEATYCYKIDKLDGKINFSNSAQDIYNQYRAYKSWPGIYCFYKKLKLDLIEVQNVLVEEIDNYKPGEVFKKNKAIYIKCQDSALELIKVRLESKKETSILDFLNGHKDFVGAVLE